MHQTGRMVTKQVARTRGHGAIKEKITHPQRGSATFVVAHAGPILKSLVRQEFVIRGRCGVVLVCVLVNTGGVARLLGRGIRLIISCTTCLTKFTVPRFEPLGVSVCVDLFQVRKRERRKQRRNNVTCTTTRESYDGVSTCPGHVVHVVQGQHLPGLVRSRPYGSERWMLSKSSPSTRPTRSENPRRSTFWGNSRHCLRFW